LQYEDYVATICTKGKTGLDILKQETFHLLILDVMLPDTETHEVQVGHKAVNLTSAEFALLEVFM